jgi:hypothetical protein
MNNTINQFRSLHRYFEKKNLDFCKSVFPELNEIELRLNNLVLIEARITKVRNRLNRINRFDKFEYGKIQLDYETFFWVSALLLKLISRINPLKSIEKEKIYKRFMILRNKLLEHTNKKGGVKPQSFGFTKDGWPVLKPFFNATILDRGFYINYSDLKKLLYKYFSLRVCPGIK